MFLQLQGAHSAPGDNIKTKKIDRPNGQCGMKLETFSCQELVLVKSGAYIQRRYLNF